MASYSRAQLLINLATGAINPIQEEQYSSSDVFISNSYDPTCPNTSEIQHSNHNEATSALIFANNLNGDTESPQLFTELQDVPFEELIPSVTESHTGDATIPLLDSINPVPVPESNCVVLNEKLILNEETGEFVKDTKCLDETYNDDDFYLDEKSGMLQFRNAIESDTDDNYTSSEIDEEEISKSRESNRKQRICGKKYLSRKKIWNEEEEKMNIELVVKPEKCLQEKPCNHSCISKSDQSLLCGLISETKRRNIFSYFWGLGSWDAKKAYLKNLVRLRCILKRRKGEENSQKSLAYDYYFPDDDDNLVKVCKRFLLSTLNIKSDTLSDWMKKLQDNRESKDLRSRHEKRKAKIAAPNEPSPKYLKSDSVKEWLNLINKVPSHYCRSSSTIVYVEDTFESKSHMYRVYTDWCKDNGKSSAGRKIFNITLDAEKTSIFKPRKDQCDVCTAKKEGHVSDEEYSLHILKKQEAYKAHSDAVAICSSEVLVVTIDVQSILLCPKILVSDQYYKQKLQVHNYSMYINNNKDVHLYVWHEGDGGVSSNTFTTCLVDFIKSQTNYKKVIIITDGCSYQNRNKILSSALLKLSNEINLEIEQIILEKGHTMMEVDSVHSTLEKKFRPPIYSPNDYISRMREARPKQPYHVHHVDYSFFKNYEETVCFDSIRPGKKTGDPTVNDIRALLYKDGSVFYKLRHPEDWQALPQRIRALGLNSCPNQLYHEPQKIEESKYDCLQALKKYMHRDYHAFYDNLQHYN